MSETPLQSAPPELVTLDIDGRQLSAPPGTVLVDAAAAHGIEIPIFCYEPRLGAPIGACRMCLVEVEGMRGMQTACSTAVAPDMVVRTTTPAVKEAQDGILELLLANHPLDCPVCDKGGECPLQDRTFRFGPGKSRFVEPKRHFPKPLDLSSLVALDRERCIVCFRCIRFSQDVSEDRNLTFEDRGGRTEVATSSGDSYDGRFTGNVIDLCPVGALTSIPYRFVSRPWDVDNAPSVCGHCPVGCNTELTMREGQVKRVTGRPAPNMAVEEGWLCDKGRWAYGAGRGPGRVTEALVREGRELHPATLDQAVDEAALLLGRAAAPALLVGPGATVEEGFLAQELAASCLRGARVGRIGIPGGALAALRALPGAQLGDLDRADLVAVVGGDPAQAQPVVELRLRKARRLGAEILVVGPRETAVDRLGGVERTPAGRLIEGLPALGALLDDADHAVVLWDEADLAGQPDAAHDLAGLIAGHAGVRQLELGADVNGAGLRALGISAEGMLDAAMDNRIGTLVAVHADPMVSPGAGAWEQAIRRVGPVIAIASQQGPITEVASVVLPACDHYETEGVLVSMNGRAQRLRPGASGPGGAAPGWELLVAISHRLGTPLPYRTARTVFAAAAQARPALGGCTYEALGVFGLPLGPLETAAPNGDPTPGPLEPAGHGLLLVPRPAIFADADTARSPGLAGVRTRPTVTVHPLHAARLGVAVGAPVRVSASHGSVVLPLAVDESVGETAVHVGAGAPDAPGVERLLAPDRGPVRAAISLERYS